MQRKLDFTIGLFFVFVILLSSCGTTGLHYTVTYPAAIELPKTETLRLGIVTWFDTTRFSDGNKKDRIIVESYYYFSEALTNRLLTIDNLLLVTPSIKLERSHTRETPPDIAPDQVIEKCERMASDYFLVIEDFKITRHKDLVIFNGDEQSRSIQTSVTLTLYAKSGARINRSEISRDNEISSEETGGFLEGLLTPKPSIKQNAHLLVPQSEAIVEEYLQKFRPLSLQVYRAAYSKNEFENFVGYFQRGEYKAAEKLLIPLTENSKIKVSKRAMYNMYILREAEGKLGESQEWLAKYNMFKQ